MNVKHVVVFDDGFYFEGWESKGIEELVMFESEVGGREGVVYYDEERRRHKFFELEIEPLGYFFVEKEGSGWFLFYVYLSSGVCVSDVCGIRISREKKEEVESLFLNYSNDILGRGGRGIRIYRIGSDGKGGWRIYFYRDINRDNEIGRVESRKVVMNAKDVDVAGSVGVEGVAEKREEKKYIEVNVDVKKRDVVMDERESVTDKQRGYLKSLLGREMGIEEGVADYFMDRITKRDASRIIDMIKEKRHDEVRREIGEVIGIKKKEREGEFEGDFEEKFRNFEEKIEENFEKEDYKKEEDNESLVVGEVDEEYFIEEDDVEGEYPF